MGDLETSALPVDTTNETSRAVTNKRRSSIFQRRSINPRQDYDESEYEEPKPEVFDLSKYIYSLRKEEAEWRRTLKERKSRRRQLTKELNSRSEVDFDLSILSESDRAFVLEKPDYDSISESIDNLGNLAEKVSTMNSQVSYLHETMVERLKTKIISTRSQLLNLSNV